MILKDSPMYVPGMHLPYWFRTLFILLACCGDTVLVLCSCFADAVLPPRGKAVGAANTNVPVSVVNDPVETVNG